MMGIVVWEVGDRGAGTHSASLFWQVFKRIDKDSNGYVDRHEMRAAIIEMFGECSEDVLAKMMDKVGLLQCSRVLVILPGADTPPAAF